MGTVRAAPNQMPSRPRPLSSLLKGTHSHGMNEMAVTGINVLEGSRQLGDTTVAACDDSEIRSVESRAV